MYELQRKVAIAIGKSRNNSVEKVKSLGPDVLLDLVCFTSEEYTAHIGKFF